MSVLYSRFFPAQSISPSASSPHDYAPLLICLPEADHASSMESSSSVVIFNTTRIGECDAKEEISTGYEVSSSRTTSYENLEKRFPSENIPLSSSHFKMAFLIIFLVVAGLSNWAVLAYTHDFSSREPLPDIIFLLIPESKLASYAADAAVSLCLCCLFTLLFFHHARFIIFRRVLFISATLYSMRSITLMATQLPPGYTNNSLLCRETTNLTLQVFSARLLEQTIRLGFQEKEKMLCGDMLFSGHTLLMMTSALTIAHYLPRCYKLLSLVSSLLAYCGMFCLVVSRSHYTTDVVIAYWLTNFVFVSYHSYCEMEWMAERERSVFSSYSCSRLLSWLENDIYPGRLENTFSDPLRGMKDWLGSLWKGNSHRSNRASTSSMSATSVT